jgi:hypothetical protein
MIPTRAASPLQVRASLLCGRAGQHRQTTAEQAALKAVPGTVHETELVTSDNGFVVYDIEVAGKESKISVPRSLDATHVLASMRA